MTQRAPRPFAPSPRRARRVAPWRALAPLWGLALLIHGGGEAAAEPPLQGIAAPQGEAVEALVRERHLGLARLENAELDAALVHLRRAAGLGGGQALDRFNLGLALLAQGELEAAAVELAAAGAAAPQAAGPPYAQGVLALRKGAMEEAGQAFGRALERAPEDCATLYNLAAIEEQLGQREVAAERYRKVMKLGWSVGGRHFLASLYRHARIQLALGRRDEAKRELDLYRDYFRRVGKPGGEPDLQNGPLLWPVPVPVPPALIPRRGPAGPLRLAAAAPAVAPPSPALAAGPRGLVAADLDGDGAAELLVCGPAGLLLLDDRGAGLVPKPVAVLGGATPPCLQVQPGDADNDGDLDLWVSALPKGRFLRNRGDGTFEDLSAAAGLETWGGQAAVWADLDQEGDLDLLLLGAREEGRPVGDRVLRNLGDGRFEAAAPGPALGQGSGASVDAQALDLDDDGDLDLLLARPEQWTLLLSSLREGRYEELGRAQGLAQGERARRLAVADLDGDGRWDLLSLGPEGLSLRAGGPQGFGPPRLLQPPGAEELLVVDLDLDGLEDLALAGPGARILILRNRGAGQFERALELAAPGPVLALAALDLDRDRDLDLVSAGPEGLTLWRNETSPQGRSLRVSLLGRKNNRTGQGSLVELRAPDFYARRVVGAGPLLVGLGDRAQLDALRVRWPNGLFQHVVDPAVDTDLRVQEVQELAGSCPFLYTWDGERWQFVSDFLGGGGLGLPTGDGGYLPPDPDEYLFVPGEALRPDGGHLKLQLTEELREEQLYLDHARLHVLDHPEGSHIYPDERFTIPGPRGERRLAFWDREAQPLVRVTDDFGVDRTELLAARDGRMLGAYIAPPEQFRGLSEPHGYVFDLGDTRSVKELWLVLVGWVYWAGGSTGVAAGQHPQRGLGPVSLEVEQEDGTFRLAIPDIGFPSGKTKIMPVDLAPALRPSPALRVRLRTALRLHWDQAIVVRDPSPVPLREVVLQPEHARLYERGFSRRIDDHVDLPERFVFEEPVPPTQRRFNQGLGLLTRFGDVLPLVQAVDDRLAIFSAGDALELGFSVADLAPPPPGWRRDYLFFAQGWNKDGDPNNGTGATVEPLPFGAMRGYPYEPAQSYPDDPALRAYRREWNTRPGRRWVEDLRPTARATP